MRTHSHSRRRSLQDAERARHNLYPPAHPLYSPAFIPRLLLPHQALPTPNHIHLPPGHIPALGQFLSCTAQIRQAASLSLPTTKTPAGAHPQTIASVEIALSHPPASWPHTALGSGLPRSIRRLSDPA